MNCPSPAEATAAFMRDVFEHYTVPPDSLPRVAVGQHLETIDKARADTRLAWLETFGVTIPEHFIARDYTLDKAALAQKAALTSEIRKNLGNSILQKMNTDDSSEPGQIEAIIWDRAARIMLNNYSGLLNYRVVQPDMMVDEELEAVPDLISQMTVQNKCRTPDRGCVTAVFGMNAGRVFENDEAAPGAQFNIASAFLMLGSDFGYQRDARHNLPWLLGSFGTDYAAERSGLTTGVITTIGMDLGEISERVISPLRTKAPDAKFILNTVIASTPESASTNHAVTVLGTGEGFVNVLDPKHSGSYRVPTYLFWNKWILTNLQSVITVMRPLG